MSTLCPRSRCLRNVGCHVLLCFAIVLSALAKTPLLGDASPSDFPLVAKRTAAQILLEETAPKALRRTVGDLESDIAAVSGVRPAAFAPGNQVSGDSIVLVGIVGASAALDRLIAQRKFDSSRLRDAWETYAIDVVTDPWPGTKQALVIAGSDCRGAIFGCYELSRQIGVSPWHWWADLKPVHRDTLYIKAGLGVFGPPSVKYRGIFLNDEDWGLEPWAAKTFEPENGSIGPKTYARVFELLLRLNANTLWPAMHGCTKPFNAFAENARLADEYGIVMGSSHAEPMLRNNVGEWPHDRVNEYNYLTNRETVRRYWEERVVSNGRFENIYTLGMRGIHDSGMQGGRTDQEQIHLLEEIFHDQRALLSEHLPQPVTQVPQMFCAYKEVLDLYRKGLRVPDDVTIVWPDDNFGYVRHFPSQEERQRHGGFGVYYHLSYLGAPLSYLWLYTTPPALVWEEMRKAYEHGARTIWIANVGDLKPAEIGTEFFLQLAWNVDRWDRGHLPDFLRDWGKREFGEEDGDEVAAIMSEYFLLNFRRKPEHLQWWVPGETPRPSPFTRDEASARLQQFATLRDRVNHLRGRIPAERRDAFFELVEYPVVGSALANERYFCGEFAAFSQATKADKQGWLLRALKADQLLKRETTRFNEEIAGGKWRHLMQLEPADTQWTQFRLTPWEPPMFLSTGATPSAARSSNVVATLAAGDFVHKSDRPGAAWQVVPGLGQSGCAVTVFPTTAAAVAIDQHPEQVPRLDYLVQFPSPDEYRMRVCLLPTQPIRDGGVLRFAFALDDDPPTEVVRKFTDGSADWAQGVLNATILAEARLTSKRAGKHILHLFGTDPGVVIDKIFIERTTDRRSSQGR